MSIAARIYAVCDADDIRYIAVAGQVRQVHTFEWPLISGALHAARGEQDEQSSAYLSYGRALDNGDAFVAIGRRLQCALGLRDDVPLPRARSSRPLSSPPTRPSCTGCRPRTCRLSIRAATHPTNPVDSASQRHLRRTSVWTLHSQSVPEKCMTPTVPHCDSVDCA